MEIEKEIGAQLRLVRLVKKKSRAQVAKGAKVSINQIQKYENGVDRVSVNRLYDIAKFLKVSAVDLLPDFMKTKK